jgi:hypothetical protein
MFHTVFGPPNGNPSPEVIATLGKHNYKDNARLIAAAPQMLRTLQEELDAIRVWLSADSMAKDDTLADVVDGMFASIEKIKAAIKAAGAEEL